MNIENTEPTTPEEVVVTPPADADGSMGAAWDRLMVNNGSDRAEDGKFVSANADAEIPAEGVAPEGAGEDGSVPNSAIAPAPAHLTGAIKSEWANIPEKARNEIARLTDDWHRKFGELGDQLGRVKPIAEKLTTATTQFPEFRGMTADQIADGALQLAAVQARLEKGPEAALSTIMQIAQAYNVLPALARSFQAQQGTEQVAALQQQIASLEAKLQQAGNPDAIRETVSMTLRERETESLVQSFSSEKEHWAEVEAVMPTFIRAIQEKGGSRSLKETLDAAYDMAINAIPEVREKVRAAEAKATAALPDPKRTDAARRAASINVKSSATGKERALTSQEAMAAAYDRAMAN